jgi:dihydropteroate synthase
MVEEGADIVDVGAVSTRPGADDVPESEERKRLAEILPALRCEFPGLPLSVDTYRSEIAAFAADQGADIINDISGGTFDPAIFDVVARHGLGYILMHIKGTPKNMQRNPQYDDVVEEIKSFFICQSKAYFEAGCKKESLVLDPGFGFGKTLEHNYRILHHLDRFVDMGYPVLAAVSRKSMINKLLNVKPEAALNGTSVVHSLALLRGASMLRVHDVKEAREVAQIVQMFQQEGQ